MSIFYWKIFPDCFIEGIGLTPFKKISEYIISLILAASLFFLLRKKDKFDRQVLQWLVISILLTIVSELAFTFYISVYGLSNLVGHIFKILAFYFIYRAIVVTGLTQPQALLYRNLGESENRFRELFNHTSSGVVVYEAKDNGQDFIFQDINQMAEKIDKIKKENIIGKSILKVFPRVKDFGLFKVFQEVYQSGEPQHLPISQYQDERNSGWRENYIYKLPSGEIVAIYNDITERKKAEEALRKSQQQFASLFQSNPEATLYLDKKGNIQNINSRFRELFGYTLEEIKGKNIDSGLIQPPDKIKESKGLTQKSFNGDHISIETIRKKKDGSLFPVSLSASPLYIEGKYQGVIGIYQDISKRKEMEEKIEKLARIETLTGCYTRRYGLELLDRQMKLSQRNKSHLLVAFLDIDNFKTINDTFGHNEGDKVLKEIVKLFRSSVREVDIICRMGGDEFLLAFPDSSLQEVTLIRDRLQKKLTQLNKYIDRGYTIGLSMGFSEYLSDKSKNSDDLISIADRRMYEEKKNKKKSLKVGYPC